MYKKSKAALCVSIVISIFNGVFSHSWLECTDYKVATDAQQQYYDASVCKGYGRCGGRQLSAGFGVDTGFNFNPSDASQCQCAKETDAITTAQYTPGQRVCLAYPAKNHVADSCTNAYIPDNGVTIRRTAVGNANPTGSADFPQSYENLNGAHVNGVVDYKGFQNCPKFCENPDKALCTMCFTLESDISPGSYVFQWLWEFNTNHYYSTCWDATVVGSYDNATTTTSSISLSVNETIDNDQDESVYDQDESVYDQYESVYDQDDTNGSADSVNESFSQITRRQNNEAEKLSSRKKIITKREKKMRSHYYSNLRGNSENVKHFQYQTLNRLHTSKKPSGHRSRSSNHSKHFGKTYKNVVVP